MPKMNGFELYKEIKNINDKIKIAFCEVYSNDVDDNNSHSKLNWNNKDDVWSLDYKVPDFKTIHLGVNLKEEEKGKIPKLTDKIDSISIKLQQQYETIEIRCESEADIIDKLVT